LALRFPLETEDHSLTPDYTIAVSEGAHAWTSWSTESDGLPLIGTTVDQNDDGNPIGPLTAATFATAEVFKWAFRQIYPERAEALQLTPWSGVFSLFSYDEDSTSPAITDIASMPHSSV